MPEYFLHCLPENQVVLPEYYLIFCPNMAIWKILGAPPPPRTPIITSAAKLQQIRYMYNILQTHRNYYSKDGLSL